jgi:hypothetical protein
VWWNWDYPLLSNNTGTAAKPLGTPVKLLKQPSGRYKVQMQSTNYGLTYSYFSMSPDLGTLSTKWVVLNTVDTAAEFALTAKDKGYTLAMYQSSLIWTLCYTIAAEKPWALLGTANQPTDGVVWTFIPA